MPQGLFKKTLALLFLRTRLRHLEMLLVVQLKMLLVSEEVTLQMARKQAQVALELSAKSAWEAAHLFRMQLRVLLWLRHKTRLQPRLEEMPWLKVLQVVLISLASNLLQILQDNNLQILLHNKWALERLSIRTIWPQAKKLKRSYLHSLKRYQRQACRSSQTKTRIHCQPTSLSQERSSSTAKSHSMARLSLCRLLATHAPNTAMRRQVLTTLGSNQISPPSLLSQNLS